MQPNIQFIKLSRCLLRVYYHNAHKIFQRQPNERQVLTEKYLSQQSMI
jgi:hypothetical protein